ncbi:hypothetical protein M408DRAFT_283392 [Serendipita vermifera MAFF 305830]|uniref:Uncharacterized protein n=1 Tax=Serendipita vermifera MAFF 305830 TaxID=933852 RepID=A0A0C3ARA0_SERVB|nr:hypothetical protein M408DRAFT_283392 [Serendipita vermifera MAFF 305830]
MLNFSEALHQACRGKPTVLHRYSEVMWLAATPWMALTLHDEARGDQQNSDL